MKKMSLSQTQVTGEGENVKEALVKATKALAKYGMDGAKMAAELQALIDAAVRENADQEEMKRKLKAQTAVVEAAYRKVQVTASGFLDMVIAAVDKDSDEAANFRRIRSRVFRPAPGPEPLPVPVKDGPG